MVGKQQRIFKTKKTIMKEENDYIGNVECTKSETSEFTVGKIYRFPNPIDNSGEERYISILKGGIWTFTPITKEEFNQKTDMRTITAEQAQEIIDIACGTWKLKLASIWSKDIVLKKSINITEDDYKEMRGACNYSQNELFDEIFGKDECHFKVGDWVIAKEGGYPARQVEKVQYNCLNVGKDNGVYSFDYCRLATEEEILKAKYKIGDWVYVIDGKSGARGANGKVGQITDAKSNNGLFSFEEGVSISIGSKIWKVCPNAELRMATEQEITESNVIPEGTPCLARDNKLDTWKFVYSNGNGKFDSGASIELPWKYVQVLDVNNLPEYNKI